MKFHCHCAVKDGKKHILNFLPPIMAIFKNMCLVSFSKTSSDKHEEILTSLVSGFENSKKHFSMKVEEELNGRSE